jgi:ankyrin repeat protein
MNVKRFGSSATSVSFVFLAMVCGCSPAATPLGTPSMKQVPPSEFYTDPLQERLAVAVDEGDASAVEAAVRAGADLHAWGKDGYSILYWALARNNVAGFEALVENGADITGEYRDPATLKENRFRDFVIQLALEVPDPAFLGAALRHGLDPNYELDKTSKESLLFLAGMRHNEPAMQMLLDSKANIEHQNLMGYTPLGEAGLRCDFKTMWFLLQRGADPMTGNDQRSDVPTQFKTYGSRGVRPDQREYFEKVVAKLIERGLLTRQDIVEADKPKRSAMDDGPPGVTVIEHSPDSEAGQAILEMDRKEREANERDRR